MAAMNGNEGAVTLGSSVVAIVDNWKVTDKANLEETSGMEVGHSGYKGYSQTLPDWSGSFEGWVSADVGDQAAFKGSGSTYPVISKGQRLEAVFTNDLGDFSGTIIIEQVEITTNTSGFVEFSVSFQGDGQLLYPGMS